MLLRLWADQPYRSTLDLDLLAHGSSDTESVRRDIADAHEGLKAAAAKVLKSTWQRCRVHFIRNAPAHAGKGQRQMVLAMINTVFARDTQ
jgi:transposase-like protein